MSITLAEFLRLPVVVRARPEVLVGKDQLDREVRWVHTSEVYDIAPLLKGQEVLLTTGLGLVGANPAVMRRYVHDLADRGLAALVVEIGRSFPTIPPPIVSTALERSFPLIAFHGVVPFIEIAETVHEMLVELRITELRLSEDAVRGFVEVLTAGRGIGGLLEACSVRTNGLVVLRDSGGQVVSSSSDIGTGALDTPEIDLQVSVLDREWGRLQIFGDDLARYAEIVAERAASAVTLELMRSGDLGAIAPHSHHAFMSDLLDGRIGSAEDARTRAAMVGLRDRRDSWFLGLSASIGRIAPGRATRSIVSRAVCSVFPTALVDNIDEEMLAIVSSPPMSDQELRRKLHELSELLDVELHSRTGGHVIAIAAGCWVESVPELGRSISLARETRLLISRLGLERLALASDIGLYRLLSRLAQDGELALFVDEQLGALVAFDSARGQSLVDTLATLLESDLSKAVAAQRLGIRRQTLYTRLAKIDELTGGGLADSHRRTALALALMARRIRWSGVRASELRPGPR